MRPPKKTLDIRGSSGLIYTFLFLASMLILYIGERLVVDSPMVRAIMGGLSLAGIIVAILGRLVRRKKVPQAARTVESRLLLCYMIAVGALFIYLAQADLVMDKIRPLFEQARSADRYQGVLGVLWPTIWVCAVIPLLFIEISYAPMNLAKTLEVNRIKRSTASGLLLSLTCCLLFVLNYVFAEFDTKVDLSYFKTTQASESSKRMVENLSTPAKALLFFPGANEVRDQVASYFEDLAKSSKHFSVKFVDHVLEPKLAKEYSVSNNGTIALVQKKKHQLIRIGTKLERAKRKLRKLDNEFQKAFYKLTRSNKVAYITVGHDELRNQPRDKVRGTSIRGMRNILDQLNYQVKDLGLGQGLGSGVPKDASLVIIAGPKKEFLPAEEASLKQYLKKGGKVMAFLDPEAGVKMGGLLQPFGVKYTPTRLANSALVIRMSNTQADRYTMITNRFSAHPSVTTLARHSNRVAMVVSGAGYLEEIPPEKGLKTQVQFTVHSMPMTWNDLNQNHTFDAKEEKRKIYELAAVATMRIGNKGKKDPKDKTKKSSTDEMRLLVVADADVITDRFLGVVVVGARGNLQFFVDALKWMVGDEELIGETTSEEDIRIVHTRKEDLIWFYLTIFGVPSLVLGAGIFYTRRRKRS